MMASLQAVPGSESAEKRVQAQRERETLGELILCLHELQRFCRVLFCSIVVFCRCILLFFSLNDVSLLTTETDYFDNSQIPPSPREPELQDAVPAQGHTAANIPLQDVVRFRLTGLKWTSSSLFLPA